MLKVILRTLFIVQIITFFVARHLSATVDMPVFYRTPFFQGEAKSKPANWATSIEVRYGQSQTSNSWDADGNTKPLLSVYGSTDLTKLGLGITRTGAIAKGLWDDASNWGKDHIAADNTAPINFYGRIHTIDAAIQLRQHILYGFFAQVFMPVRQVKVDHISYKNLGVAAPRTENVITFFTTKFDDVLTENGIKNWDKAYSKTAATDVALTVGWQGYAALGSSLIADVGGNVQGGVVLPLAGQRDDSYLSSISMGFNKSIGLTARGSGEVGVFDWLGAGVYGSSTIFLPVNQTLRLKNHEAQSGWLFLKKGYAEVDQGTLWDVGGYVRGGSLSKGFSVILGASYTRQDQTDLTMKDSNFTVWLRQNGAPTFTESPNQGDKNYVVNYDRRWRGWGVFVLHSAARLQLGGHDSTIAPLIQVEYNYPWEGKLVFKGSSYAGTLGLTVKFDF